MNIRHMFAGWAVVLLVAFVSFGNIPQASAAVKRSPVGATVRDAAGAIYLISAGERRPYESEAAFFSYGFNIGATVSNLLPADERLPIGQPIKPREGALYCPSHIVYATNCYLLQEGRKSYLASEDEFIASGYRAVSYVPFDVGMSYPVSTTDILSHWPRPVGAVLKLDGLTYLRTNLGLAFVPNGNVLRSWGFNESDVLVGNEGDRTGYIGGTLVKRQPGELVPTRLQPFAKPLRKVTLPMQRVPLPAATVPEGSYSVEGLKFKISAPRDSYVTFGTMTLKLDGTLPLEGIESITVGGPHGGSPIYINTADPRVAVNRKSRTVTYRAEWPFLVADRGEQATMSVAVKLRLATAGKKLKLSLVDFQPGILVRDRVVMKAKGLPMSGPSISIRAVQRPAVSTATATPVSLILTDPKPGSAVQLTGGWSTVSWVDANPCSAARLSATCKEVGESFGMYLIPEQYRAGFIPGSDPTLYGVNAGYVNASSSQVTAGWYIPAPITQNASGSPVSVAFQPGNYYLYVTNADFSKFGITAGPVNIRP